MILGSNCEPNMDFKATLHSRSHTCAFKTKCIESMHLNIYIIATKVVKILVGTSGVVFLRETYIWVFSAYSACFYTCCIGHSYMNLNTHLREDGIQCMRPVQKITRNIENMSKVFWSVSVCRQFCVEFSPPRKTGHELMAVSQKHVT